MKKTYLAILAGLLLTGASFGFDAPYGRRGNNGNQTQTQTQPKPNPKRDGTGGGARAGRKTGPQDGTGPIHTPGTGGGTGAGRRSGRR